AGFEGEPEKERQRREPQVADRVGDGPGVERFPFLHLARWRAAAIEAEEAADAAAAEGRRVTHRLPAAPAPPLVGLAEHGFDDRRLAGEDAGAAGGELLVEGNTPNRDLKLFEDRSRLRRFAPRGPDEAARRG